MQKKVEQNGIYNICIKNRKDIIHLMNNVKNSKEYSVAIVTDMGAVPRMVLDIPNKFLNMQDEQLRGYFQNISRENGGSNIFLATNDKNTFIRSTKLIEKGIFKDTVFYYEINGELCMYNKPEFISKKIEGKGIFEEATHSKTIRVGEESTQYSHAGKSEEFLRILYKEVGEMPKVMKIRNTLKEKQKLVGGLIEVIPYKDALIVCNEEGKLLNMGANLIFEYDYIAGNCFVVGDDYKNGDFKSLTDKQIEEYMRDFLIRGIRKQKNILLIR